MTELSDLLNQYAPSEELWSSWHEQLLTSIVQAEHDAILSKDQCWLLAEWAEIAASQAVRTRDSAILESALLSLAIVERQEILDRRDLWLKVDVVHRGSELIGATVSAPTPSSIAERFSSREGGPLSTHSQNAVGPTFEFTRHSFDINIDRLTDWFNGETETS